MRVQYRRSSSAFRHGFPTLSARSSLTRSRMTSVLFAQRQAADVGDARSLLVASPANGPRSAAILSCRVGKSPRAKISDKPQMQFVILDLVSEERAESVGNPCRNINEVHCGAELPKLKPAGTVGKDSHPISTQPIVSTHPTHFFTPDLSPSFPPLA